MLYAGFSFTLLYVGPGMSGGVVAVLVGILSAFVLSVIAIIWYPIKKALRFIRSIFKKSE
jgi:uncharacterized membrane protein